MILMTLFIYGEGGKIMTDVTAKGMMDGWMDGWMDGNYDPRALLDRIIRSEEAEVI